MTVKGLLPLLVLQTLTKGPCHGYALAQQIKARSEGVLDYREGTLYPALHQLEAEGLIASEERQEQGRTRRFYRLTQKGEKRLRDERGNWTRFRKAVQAVLEEPA